VDGKKPNECEVKKIAILFPDRARSMSAWEKTGMTRMKRRELFDSATRLWPSPVLQWPWKLKKRRTRHLSP
jgi:hypothetical protein